MKRFKLIGKNTSNSLSPYIHNFVFHKSSISAEYSNINMKSGKHLKEIVSNLKSGIIQGANITNPYKIAVIKYIGTLDVSAKKIGAVNCLSFQNGKVCGHNTDWIGFKKMIKAFSL